MIKKMLNSKTIVTIICLIICGVIIVFAYNSRVNKKINRVTIPVASRRINAREEIFYSTDKKDKELVNVRTEKVAKSLLSSNVIQKVDYFVKTSNTTDNEENKTKTGKYVNYNTFIPEGGMFYNSSVVIWDDMPDSAWYDIGENQTIIYIDIIDAASYGNAIYPGDVIDLYIKTLNTNNKKIVYAKFVEKIKVLAVKDENGNHISKRTPSSGRPSQIIFSLDDSVNVDENLFLLLKSATLLGSDYEIVPIPRNKNYKIEDGEQEAEIVNADFFVSDIRRKSLMLLPDNVVQNNPTVKE